MDGPYDTGPPAWNPATEIFPGGPHPGAVAHWHEERAAEAERRRLEEEERAREKRLNHLLLLR